MVKRGIFLAAVLAASAPATAFADPAHGAAAPGPNAQALADQAYDAYSSGDYAKALELYQDSYRLAPAADILFNIAKIYDTKLKDKQLAIEYYRRYNSAPDAKGELVGQATARIAALSNDSAPGPAAGSQPAPDKPASPPPESDPGATWRVVGLITGGVGLAGLVVGTAFGLSAKSKHNTATSGGCSGGACPDATSAQSERDAASAATISTVGFVAGGALLAGGVLMVLLAPSKASTESKPSTEPAQPPAVSGVRLAPAVGFQSVGLSLTGKLF